MLFSLPADAEEMRVTAVADDLSLRLEDGREARLFALDPPLALLDGKGAAEPAALIEARRRLRALAERGNLRLAAAEAPDRWRRLPVLAEDAEGRSLQDLLLRQGLARVRPEGGDDALLDRLFAAEDAARKAGLGLWADPAFAVKDPGEAGRWLDGVQVFEGRVSSTETFRGIVYVTFGEDRHRALSVKIPRTVRKALPGDPGALTGRRLRVRGWVGKDLGPLVEIHHPRQLQLLDGGWPAARDSDQGRDAP